MAVVSFAKDINVNLSSCRRFLDIATASREGNETPSVCIIIPYCVHY